MNTASPTPAISAFDPESGLESDYGVTFRQPPANIEIEMALLGAILVNNRTYERVSEFLFADHFAEPAHRRIYEAAATVIERGQQASPVTLMQYFEHDESLVDIGGPRYLAELAANTLNTIDARDFGRIIYDLHLRRELIDLGETVVNDAYAADIDSDAKTQIESTEHKLFELASSGNLEGGFAPFSRTLAKAIDMAEAAFRREGRLTGVTTGFTQLDRLLGGLQPSDLLVLAGRPGMGKTALATNIAFNAAKAGREEKDADGNFQVVKDHVIGFFSLEMSSEQLALRILGEVSGVSSDRVRRGQINNDEFQKVFEASQDISRLGMFIDDTPALSVAALRTRARRLMRTQGRLDLVIVDYLQLMQASPSSRPENRVQEVSEITRGLKAMAKDLDVPVLALSQLSRAVEQREDKRPQLSDLRESGSIEQDADVVMFVYREDYYLSRREPTQGTPEYADWQSKMDLVHNLAEVIIAKQRHGPTDKVRLHFNGELTKFGNWERGDEHGDAPF